MQGEKMKTLEQVKKFIEEKAQYHLAWAKDTELTNDQRIRHFDKTTIYKDLMDYIDSDEDKANANP